MVYSMLPPKRCNYEFDYNLRSEISVRMVLYLTQAFNLKPLNMVKISIPYLNDSTPPYEAVGLVFKVKIISRSDIRVIVDINTKVPSDIKKD